MVEAKHRISSADIFLALGRRPVVNGTEIPLGGRPATPDEEARMGEQLRRELQDYRAGVVKARDRVLQAMSGKSTNSVED